MLLLLVLACSGCQSLDPELEPHRNALAAWEEGSAALDRGDHAAARAAFQKAQDFRSEDVLLIAWEAEAAADGGDLDAAIALLDSVLRQKPAFAEARYNRAAYMARRGDPPDRVAADLKQALTNGARQPRDVLSDPDFEDLLDDPNFGFLPDSPLMVAVDAPQDTVFLGSEVSFRFRVSGAGTSPIGVSVEQSQGPVRLVSVVEDEMPSTEGPMRDLRYTVKAIGGGTAKLGPFHISAGDFERVVPPIIFECKAPPGRDKPGIPDDALPFETPGELAVQQKPPSIWLRDGQLLVLSEPGDQVVIKPRPADDPIRYELRRSGQILWRLARHPNPGAPHVTMKRGGKVLFDGVAQ